MKNSSEPSTFSRREWMSLLAKAQPVSLEETWLGLSPAPRYRFLRRAESGLVMVRARIGGTGNPFNLGEMTVTRCSVVIETGQTGHAYIAGRDRRHAELAAVFDALLQDEANCHESIDFLIHSLAIADAERRKSTRLQAAATKVDFFTMVRGDS